MKEQTKLAGGSTLPDRYLEALNASGLTDDVIDIPALEPHPLRYAEGEFICKHGDPVHSLWIIVNGSVAVKEGDTTFFMRRRNEVVGEQHIVGNGYSRIYDLVAAESSVELLAIEKSAIDAHPEASIIWRNIARIISLKLRNSSRKAASLSRQLEDDTRILHAYTNQYALSRRLQSGSGHQADYQVERAVIWFSDIIDFSRYALKLSPDRTADIVQRFFNAQSHPIVERGGHVDKFIGDGLMAFWVLPEKSTGGDREITDALRAAEDAVKAVSEISIGQSALRLRIGLHVGLVLSGDFGSATRHQFTLIGKEVNKAARLEQIRDEEIEGSHPLGDIRLSEEFRNELSQTLQRRYSRKQVAKAKNIGTMNFYTR